MHSTTAWNLKVARWADAYVWISASVQSGHSAGDCSRRAEHLPWKAESPIYPQWVSGREGPWRRWTQPPKGRHQVKDREGGRGWWWDRAHQHYAKAATSTPGCLLLLPAGDNWHSQGSQGQAFSFHGNRLASSSCSQSLRSNRNHSSLDKGCGDKCHSSAHLSWLSQPAALQPAASTWDSRMCFIALAEIAWF